MSGGVRHLALIPDGNRRWAQARGQAAQAGHRAGIAHMTDLAEAAFAQGVEVFTFWWGSPANLQLRDADEVAGIVQCLADWLRDAAPMLLARWDARLCVLGRVTELCPQLSLPVARAQAAQGRGPRTLMILIAYDGRDELRAAVAEAARQGTPETFEAQLWTACAPPVDLIVRTGGASHVSAGFMLWHIAEAALAFETALWPDYSAAQLRARLLEHGERPRRFGR